MIHKTTRSILSVLLAALLLVTSIPLTPAFADGGGGAVSLQSANSERGGLEQDGDGTAGNPYKIATANDLREFAKLVNDGKTDAWAELTDDIVLNEKIEVDENGTVTNQEDLSEWTPIGSISRPYSGTFNGAGHTISGLTINNSSADDQGLFGYVSGSGKVQNLSVSGSVSGGSYVGGVVGYNNGGTVTGCIFSGSGSVSGGSYVGGVVGYNYSGGSVTNSYNTGAVSGAEDVGGVVGYNDGGSVTNSYNTGEVSGYRSVGGVVGLNDSGIVENCYNTGKVIGSSVGGVVGLNNSTVTGCYFLKDTAEKGIGIGIGSGDATSVTTLDELCEKFENDNTWSIHPVLGRPVLNENKEGGLGTEASPYEISTADELENFRNLVNNGIEKSAHAKLMNDIDLKDVCGESLNGETSWTPIGNSESTAYTGTFDGQNFKISGLYIKNTSSDNDYQGLFGYVGTGGTVQNLNVSGSVKGNNYVGGVVGYNNGGTVTGCIFSGSGSVSGEWYVGGVVGRNDGTVKNCYNTGKVTGSADSSDVGGVVGLNRGTVENCYNTGEVSGNSYVGGVVGYNTSSTVTNCYFLKTADVNKNLPGIGFGGEGEEAIQKTADAFHSGEVAWRLQDGQTAGSSQVWGQNIKDGENDNYPQLRAFDADTPQVYKVAFMNGEEYHAEYANNGMTVGSPTTNPTKEGYTFAGWFTDSSGGSQWDFSTAVTKNMTLYAQWTPVAEPDPDPEPTPDPEPEEPPYTGKYSYELSTSVGDHGSLTVDRYATEGDKVTIDVTPDQAYKLDELVVTANGKDVELTANSDGTYIFTMPSADVKITATFAEDPDWTEPEEPATDVSDLFIDIAPDAWYKDAIQYAYDHGLMTGVSATEFAPEATTTRAMIVSILARLENVTTAEAAGFADVDDEWYATAVNWAANVGVVNGYEDNTFRPNTAITREQLAAILMNYAAYKGEDVSNRADLTSYTDQPSTWAQEAMQWAVAEGLISGVTNDQLQPQGNATRAQVAAILQRYLEA